MTFRDSLLQIYFLGIDPKQMDVTVDRLAKVKLGMANEADKVGDWQIYSWLGRHTVCAVREVKVTSGLDSFLLEDEIKAVEDVAEILACPFDSGEPSDCPVLRTKLSELVEPPFEDSVGFFTIGRFNRSALKNSALWAKAQAKMGVPSFSEALGGFDLALRNALSKGSWAGEFNGNLRLLVTAGLGDTDVILVGRVRKREVLDKYLYVLTQLGIDSLGAVLHGDYAKTIPSAPLFSETTTELLMPFSVTQDVSKDMSESGAISSTLKARLSAAFSGTFGGQQKLKRGRHAFAQLGGKVEEVIGNDWKERAALGDVDMLLESEEQSYEGLLTLMAKLDQAVVQSSTFPRKIAFQCTFGEAVGKSVVHDPTLRGEILSFASENNEDGPWEEIVFRSSDEDVKILRDYVKELRRMHWREELRVLERVSERAVLVKRNVSLSSYTRLTADLCLRRLAAVIEKIRSLENLSQSSDAQVWRRALVYAGMQIDRVLAHHTRGALSRLLQPHFHGRATTHFCNEAKLGEGLATIPANVIGRTLSQANSILTPAEREDPDWQAFVEQLEPVIEPIIYASHDADFEFSPPLGLIRAPRWVIWYPTAGSKILHETGHALFFLTGHREWCQRLLSDVSFLGDSDSGQKTLDSMGLRSWAESMDEKRIGNELIDIEEICADLVWGISACSPDSKGPMIRDFLDYLESQGGRISQERISLLMDRLLCSVVGMVVIQEAWLTSGSTAVFRQEPSEWHQLLKAAATKVSIAMKGWIEGRTEWVDSLGDKESSGETITRQLYKTLADYREALENCEGDTLQKRCGPGIFSALSVLSLAIDAGPMLADVRNSEKRFAALLWRSFLATAMEVTEDAFEQLTRIATALAEGRVPLETTPYPERLPLLLDQICRESEVCLPNSVPIQARFALSFYLQDQAN